MLGRWTVVAIFLLSPTARGGNAGPGEIPPEIDRSTPAATIRGFLNAAHDGEYELAARYLYLEHLPEKEQAQEGPRLARRLRFIIDRKLWLDFTKISHEPNGKSPDPRYEDLGSLSLQHINQPIRLRRYDSPKVTPIWVFSSTTVRAIDPLYAAYGPPFGEHLPEFLFRHSFLDLELWQWAGLVISLFLSIGAALLATKILLAAATMLARLKALRWAQELIRVQRKPLVLLLWAVLLDLSAHFLILPQAALEVFDVLTRSIALGGVAWLLLRGLSVISSELDNQVASRPEGAQQVGMRTQLRVLRQVISVAIFIVAGAMILMQFSTVRQVGWSLLASAGIGGVVLGLAAQKSISTLFAGIQLSLTQPIRIGDTVVVENESGIIEEITLTYVIVKLWDLRRLIIPMTYFLEKPFQNWNKGFGDMLETIMLHTNRSADVDAFRSELDRILKEEAAGLWDQRIHDIVVTETSNRTLLLRVIVSSTDARSGWNLRALIRDRLAQFLYQHPDWLPRLDINAPRKTPAPAPDPKH